MPTLDKPITIEKLSNRATGEYSKYLRAHAEINQTKVYVRDKNGSERTEYVKTFKVRWNKLLDKVQMNLQSYRIVWNGAVFRITGFDDYMQQHGYVTLQGEINGQVE